MCIAIVEIKYVCIVYMLNRHELYIEALCVVHVIIWMVVLFGGFVSRKLAVLNLYVFLPLVYVAQSMSFHAIMKEKIQYVRKNKQYLRNKELNLPDDEVMELSREANKLGMTMDEFLEVLSYIEYYADKCILPYYYESLKRKSYSSWKNPFSPQGTIIIGFILNLFCLRYRYGVIG